MSDLKQLTLFQTVCELLHNLHGDGWGTPVGTLNRLFAENLSGYNDYAAVNPPWLSEENVTITIERWDKKALFKLAPEKEIREPRFTEFPVVIVRYNGENRLIDGNSHAKYWNKVGDFGEHSAYVLTVT